MDTATNTEALSAPASLQIGQVMGNLPRYYPPARVMAAPDILRQKIVEYFTLLEPPNHPTPPGLAMAVGLSSFDTLLRVMKDEESMPGTYPPESMNALFLARSMIEDYYINGGLREALPTQFIKFLLSAFFNRSERTIQEQLGGKDTNFQISILGITPSNNAAPDVIEHSPTTLIECNALPAPERSTPDPTKEMTVLIEGVQQSEDHDSELEDL